MTNTRETKSPYRIKEVEYGNAEGYGYNYNFIFEHELPYKKRERRGAKGGRKYRKGVR